jgi:hypothetical protein
MITKEDLEKEQKTALLALEPVKAEFKKAKETYDLLCTDLSKPFNELLEKYYDEHLTDGNGKSIQIGDIISNGKRALKVVMRGMQFCFGEMMMNPRVMCLKLKDFKEAKGKEIHIFPSELKEYKIMILKIE